MPAMMKLKGAIYLGCAVYLAVWMGLRDATAAQYLSLWGTMALGVWLTRI